ncbi:YpiF family protein [Cytobacillus suaedae]|nr:YpiF family protein [Cytobacillus suaedae]
MKWVTRDMDLYLQAKEYVDTAVIPLVPATWDHDVKTTVAMGEFITILTNEMERQFKGRIILFPPFTYTARESVESRIERLTTWTSELSEKGMKYFFFVSSDSVWKQSEEKLETGSLIWLPSLPLEYVEEKYKQAMLQDQMKQLITIFMSIWQKS